MKPAYEEFIKATIRLADIIIPVGAQNTVAIDLVARHLHFHLHKEFSSTSHLDLSNKRKFNFSVTSKDIFDPRYQFFGSNIIINENESQINVLKTIFEDFINGEKTVYYSIFLDVILNNLLTIYYNKKKFTSNRSSLLLTELDDINKKHEESFIEKKDLKRIIFFKPIFLSEDGFDVLQ